MDYYTILQISTTASQEEIKKAYRRLSRKYHPDNAGEESRDLFEKVQEAYAVLGDEEKRNAYDQRQTQCSTDERPPNGKKKPQHKNENNYRDMGAFFGGKYQDSFEQFFGFGSKDKGKKEVKGASPVNTDKLFEAYFKVK